MASSFSRMRYKSRFLQPSATLLTPFGQVYDRLFYVPFTRIGTLSPEIANLTLTVGSVGKNFYCTGWRIGYLIGPEHLIKYVTAAHMRICFSSVGPLQEAAAVGFERAEEMNFWQESRTDMQGKIKRLTEVFDELGLPVSLLLNTPPFENPKSIQEPKKRPREKKNSQCPKTPTYINNLNSNPPYLPLVLHPRRRLLHPRQFLQSAPPTQLPLPSPRRPAPPRLSTQLVLTHGARRRDDPADGVLHGAQSAFGRRLAAVCGV